MIPDNIYPARGRKLTFPQPKTEGNSLGIPDNIYPARGRKQTLELHLDILLLQFPTIFTPQGDGNLDTNAIKQLISLEIPDNIYPARGRKQERSTCMLLSMFSPIPDNIYPARGRKLRSAFTVSLAWCAFPTIFTPQGDGNSTVSSEQGTVIGFGIPDNIYPARGRKRSTSKSENEVIRSADSRQYLPRKGTETIPFLFDVVANRASNSRQYLPRKGTETKRVANPHI